jgi:uncharacterized SAM-binding protein YcdF (DUF218 family)
MFFFLSKVLYYLAMPFTIVCALLLFALVTKNIKWKKRAFFSGVIMMLFFSNEFVANEMMLAWEIEARAISSLHKYKLGIVLTGTTMTHSPDDRVYFAKGADRVTHTVQLYKEGLLEKILISGGHGRIIGEAEPEANKYKRVMMMMGVPEEAIIIENETRNTAESALEVKKMLDQGGYKAQDCLLITSAFHMRRSRACYKKAGVDLDTFSTDFYSSLRGYNIDSFLIPKIEGFIIWHKLTKEWIGFIAYKVAGYV